MNEKVVVKGKNYAITSKYGMEDENGNYIIPRAYDSIVRLDTDLFAAIKSDNISYTANSEGLFATYTLTKEGLACLWQNSDLKNFSPAQIDFFSISGKFNFDKKVIACYWSKENHVLVLFDEYKLWSIAHLDYSKHEIIEDLNYIGLNEVKEIDEGRFLIERNGLYEFLSLKDGKNFYNLDYELIEPYHKGIIVKNKLGGYGVMTYSGEIVLENMKEISFEEEYIWVLNMDNKEVIYSYTGKCIVPPADEIEVTRLHSGNLLFTYIDEADMLGVYSEKGEAMLYKCTDIFVVENGMIIYCKDTKYGLLQYVDGILKEILPAKYKDIRMMRSKENKLYVGAKLRFWYDVYDLEGNKLKDSKTPPELWAKS